MERKPEESLMGMGGERASKVSQVIQLGVRSQHSEVSQPFLGSSRIQEPIAEPQIRYRSKGRSLIYGLIISMSAVNFGYALTAASVVNMPKIMQTYGITLKQSQSSALLIGLMPIGGIFGAILNKLFIKLFSRKKSLYVMFIILWFSLGLILIHNMYTILIGRFIQGISIGLFVSVSPIYMQEVTPKELRPRVMTMFSLGKVFGCVLANILQNIFLMVGWQNASELLLVFNGFLAAIQVLLYLLVVPDSPFQMIERDDEEAARKIILTIYQEKYVDEVFKELCEDYKASQGEVTIVDVSVSDAHRSVIRSHYPRPNVTIYRDSNQKLVKDKDNNSRIQKTMKENLSKISKTDSKVSKERLYKVSKKDLSKISNRTVSQLSQSVNSLSNIQVVQLEENRDDQLLRAYWMGIHIVILRQFIGGNCLVTFSGQIIKHFNAKLSTHMALILNMIQFVTDLFSVIFIANRYGRRPMLIVGTLGMAIGAIIIALALAGDLEIIVLIFMSLYMALYGSNVQTVCWGYPSEILAPDVTMIPNIIGWIAMSIVTTVPPLVVGAMPNGNAYPLFVFFGAYGIFAYVVLHFYMAESKDKTYQEIIDSF